ncbi:trafficking pga2 [Diplodia corticola]|uniref:Trafficking pga2 n=1 Tax=Diplodia corticola TaxID=236234 RepID=A0A1J9RYB0_9PEZI|nr:trafficking pga2 [Diplodia corticola]OJD33335.1 trafficking pga2 [Diplodia corticola]
MVDGDTMAAQQPDGGAHQAPDILSLLSTWGSNFSTQTTKTFSELRPLDYIRLVTIIGAYCLLRPYLMKLGAYLQRRQHEADSQSGQAAGAPFSANDLRGGKKEPKVAIPGVESDSEDEEKDDWGRAARLRQRKFVRQLLEAHETKLREEAEAESDKEIEEFLVD